MSTPLSPGTQVRIRSNEKALAFKGYRATAQERADEEDFRLRFGFSLAPVEGERQASTRLAHLAGRSGRVVSVETSAGKTNDRLAYWVRLENSNLEVRLWPRQLTVI